MASNPSEPSIMERHLMVLLHDADPAKAAMRDLELDDDALDALAIERAVQALRREAASRDGRSAGWLLMAFADRLERRQAR
ncbi:MAG TPA: hypothetical protein VNJ54_15115 [Plantibacter sp.]|uniref:hypothetical protein n=1 Tax=Plantibacter sp. TaxID=1871045 RepID=UPI002C44E250|nr:hypothetical protein [Plantibacter sp.]